MEYKEADSTGVQVPKIDLGAWQYWGVEPLCRRDLVSTFVTGISPY